MSMDKQTVNQIETYLLQVEPHVTWAAEIHRELFEDTDVTKSQVIQALEYLEMDGTAGKLKISRNYVVWWHTNRLESNDPDSSDQSDGRTDGGSQLVDVDNDNTDDPSELGLDQAIKDAQQN